MITLNSRSRIRFLSKRSWWTADIFVRSPKNPGSIGILLPKHCLPDSSVNRRRGFGLQYENDLEEIFYSYDIEICDSLDAAVIWLPARNITVEIGYSGIVNKNEHLEQLSQDGLGSDLTTGLFRERKDGMIKIKPITTAQELSLGGDCGAAWYKSNSDGKKYIVAMHTIGNNETFFPNREFAEGVDINTLFSKMGLELIMEGNNSSGNNGNVNDSSINIPTENPLPAEGIKTDKEFPTKITVQVPCQENRVEITITGDYNIYRGIHYLIEILSDLDV